MARILVGHPYWGRGGAESAAMWIIQALCSKHEVDVITRGGWHREDLNRLAGTRIEVEDVSLRKTADLSSVRMGRLAHGLYVKRARRIASDYDVRITASGVMEWGLPAIHFMSSVLWNERLRAKYFDQYIKQNVVTRSLDAVGQLIAGFRACSVDSADVFVANSAWTAKETAEFIGGRTEIVFPPVVPPAGPIKHWEARQDDVVCLGRISPEKEIDKSIKIVERLRALGFPLRMHIIGAFYSDRYCDYIIDMCNERKDWIVVEGGLYGSAKEKLISACRYGINGCSIEAFGIATAEMAASGLIVLAPRKGAQAEILCDDRVLYDGEEDAVSKFTTILNSPLLQTEIHLANVDRGRMFAPDRFAQDVNRVVENFLGSFRPRE
jgi:glycosyltransferase involved in cell wall biosynthesis